jgi:hypothetical protein
VGKSEKKGKERGRMKKWRIHAGGANKAKYGQ